jgi:hypothetical protein
MFLLLLVTCITLHLQQRSPVMLTPLVILKSQVRRLPFGAMLKRMLRQWDYYCSRRANSSYRVKCTRASVESAWIAKDLSLKRPHVCKGHFLVFRLPSEFFTHNAWESLFKSVFLKSPRAFGEKTFLILLLCSSEVRSKDFSRFPDFVASALLSNHSRGSHR